jgi:hypothetical protein
MFTSNAIRFVLFFFLSLSANAETVRGAHRVLTGNTKAVDLGDAANYAILTKTGISTVPTSAITGDIGVSPIAATAITGFSLTLDSTTQFAKSTQVSLKVKAASYGGDVATALISAVSAMETAFTDAYDRTNTDLARINLGAGTLGSPASNQLTPGVYTFDGDVLISNDITFMAVDSKEIFIIQIAGDLILNAGLTVSLDGEALAKNIFWQVSGKVKVMKGAHMEGILLVKTDVLFVTGSSLNGRVLAQTACNLQSATITQPTL